MTTLTSDITGLARRLAAQFGIFGLVGVANTLVDLACANLLFAAWKPTTPVQLSLIAIIAGALATVHSYFLNSRWTFRGTGRGERVRSRFLTFALVGLATQAAVTLFASRWLLLAGGLAPVVVLNVAKIAAVVCAAGVTFLGYRLSAFAPASLVAFREEFTLGPGTGRVPARALALLLTLAVGVRAGFVAAAPVAYGDAINYSWVAWLVGHGRAAEADAFWHGAYDYWQALLVPLGLDQFQTMVVASLIPGVLMVIPVYLIALRLYGRTTALVAGLAVALHPRLIEYSVNGYAEAFFLHAALWATWGMVVLVRQPGRRPAALVAGIAFGTWFLVRNEAVVAASLIGLAVLLAWWRSREGPSLAPVVLVALCGTVVVACYLAADVRVFGAPHLFSKASNLTREHTEMLEPREAAREAYRIDRPAARSVPPGEIAVRLLERWPHNAAYTLERLPGVLLSPLFLFALLLPAMCRRRASVAGEEWPLLAFTVWPLLFYPFLQLEPRMLLAVAIGTCIFGAAGLVTLGEFLSRRLQVRSLRTVPAALAVVALLPLIPLLARHTEAERGFHREVGSWLAASVDPATVISGDGYGYVTASGFWAGRRVLPRVWTDDVTALGRWAEAGSPRVVVLYERYLRESNPELLGALDRGIPGLVLVKSFSFERAGRIQVWSTGPRDARIASARTLR